MNVTLYSNSAENEIVDKSSYLSGGQTLSCEMVNTSIINPILKIKASYINKNYVYIPSFSRYYYVRDIETLAGTHCLLHCHVDVLYTYRPGILALDCNIVRQEYAEDNSIFDPYISVDAKKEMSIKNFPNKLSVTVNSKCYLFGVK